MNLIERIKAWWNALEKCSEHGYTETLDCEICFAERFKQYQEQKKV